VLPAELRERSRRTRVFAPEVSRLENSGLIDRLHAAIDARRVLRLDYRDRDGRDSVREVEPLCLSFWGGTWTLGGWCRLRNDFRDFRPDRIVAFVDTGERFDDHAGRGLDAYLRAVGAHRPES
jgi:predicted DNA-binding transcriptional regulator YafY